MSELNTIHKSMILDLESVRTLVGPSTSFTAGELAYLNANGEAVKLTAETQINADGAFGIADESGTSGQIITFRTTGTVENPNWNWNPGELIYGDIATPGALTLNPVGSLVLVGKAISSTKILLNLSIGLNRSNPNLLVYEAGEDLVDGDWVELNSGDSKLYKILAVSADDQRKVLGVITGNYLTGTSAKVLTYGRWDSEFPIAGPLGVRYLSIATAGEMTDAIPPQTQLVALGFKVSANTFIIRIGGSAIQHLLSFVDFPFLHGVLMLKKEIYGNLTIPSNYVAVAFDDTTINGSITFEPNSELVLLAKRTPNFLEWIGSGLAKGWNELFINGTGTTARPQYKTYTKNLEIIREQISYNPDGSYSQIVFDHSTDGGINYTTIATKTFTYDSGYLRATNWS
jgi:hypothetical protein